MYKRNVFFIIDTTLPASDPFCFILIKMTVSDQIKIIDKNIKQNEIQYHLDRKAAKISALSPKNLDKY